MGSDNKFQLVQNLQDDRKIPLVYASFKRQSTEKSPAVMIDLRQTENYSEYMKFIGWQVENCGDFIAFYRKIPLLGRFVKIQRPEKISQEKVDLLTQKLKPFQIIIEPKDNRQTELIKGMGYKPSKSYFVPSKSIQIDLTKTEKELLNNMHYKTRYNIKKSINSGMKISVTRDIRLFADLWQECARKQRGMYLSQKNEIHQIFNAFGSNAQIIIVKFKKEVLAAILMINTRDIAYYMYAASTIKGKKLFAPTFNVWSAIKLAKKNKYKIFDFEGIFDERFPIKSWMGFTRFKKSFGGSEISYPGTYYKFLIPFVL